VSKSQKKVHDADFLGNRGAYVFFADLLSGQKSPGRGQESGIKF
jgi:hypothetical protein